MNPESGLNPVPRSTGRGGFSEKPTGRQCRWTLKGMGFGQEVMARENRKARSKGRGFLAARVRR